MFKYESILNSKMKFTLQLKKIGIHTSAIDLKIKLNLKLFNLHSNKNFNPSLTEYMFVLQSSTQIFEHSNVIGLRHGLKCHIKT